MVGSAGGLTPCGRPYPQRTVVTLRHRCISMAQMVTLRAPEPLISHVTAYRITQRRLFPFTWNLRVDDAKSCRPMVRRTRPSAPNGSVGQRVRTRGGRTRGGRHACGGRIACRCIRSRRVRAVVGGSVRGSGRDGVGGSDRVVITRPVMSRPATPTRRKWCSTRSYRPMRLAPLPTPMRRLWRRNRRPTERRRCRNSARPAARHRSTRTPTARGEPLCTSVSVVSRNGCL